jgi:3',5'-cyclic AMP phosphodiesterase CpdA
MDDDFLYFVDEDGDVSREAHDVLAARLSRPRKRPAPGALQLVHLSDFHIRSGLHKEASTDSQLDRAGAKVRDLVAYIDAKYPAAHIVITGDITDSGTPEAYLVAKRLLKPWLRTSRLSLVPGNHDCGTWGNRFLPERRETFFRTFSSVIPRSASTLPWVKVVGRVALIGLDTTADSEWTAGACGQLGADQLDRLDRVLQGRSIRGRVPVLLMHHDPFDDGFFTELNDSRRLIEIIETRVRTRRSLVLYGHRHTGSRKRTGSVKYWQAACSVYDGSSFRVITIPRRGDIQVFTDRGP